MASYHPNTIEMIAAALTQHALTPRQIEPLLPVDLCRTTIRHVLAQLVAEGRAMVEGDVYQKRYRLAVPSP